MSEFGKAIKKALIDKGCQQTWLIEEVKKKTGLYFDSSYLYKIMSGKSENTKVVEAIKDILGL